MGGKDWIEGLNRIKTRQDLPITISGGEPTLHPDFFDIVNNTKQPMDLLTNGEFSLSDFWGKIDSETFKRDAPYASIRFSYHNGYTRFFTLLQKVIRLQDTGYSVGIWAVGKTLYNRSIQLLARFMDVDFRLKELLDKKHGTYKYPLAVNGYPKSCRCKPSEMLIAPDGRLFRCHFELYHGLNSYGHILDNNIKLPTEFAPCENMGMCSPCDIKLKFSRHQVWGHCSVEING